MKAQDIIRSVLDLLDQAEQQPEIKVQYNDEPEKEVEPSRFKQIFAMLSNKEQGEYSNTPNEVVTDVAAVTTDAGGGINGPKHPHDIRVAHSSMYPNQQEY
jgi:hypothetical protein